MTAAPHALPLAGLRVLDLTNDFGAACPRLLADLGADVLAVRRSATRTDTAEPIVGRVSLPGLVHGANKRRCVIDWTAPAGRAELLDLAAAADIVVESHRPGALAAAGVGPAELRAGNDHLVVTSIAPFGQTGPYRDWAADDWVLLALSSVVSRSGIPGRPPVIPPGRLAVEQTAVQASWATLVAYWNALRTGRGAYVDVSAFEATVLSMDAPFGMSGTALGGRPASELPPERPDVAHLYPIFGCADGHVRLCMLAARQWRGMLAWLGNPAEFTDPKFDANQQRFAARDRLYPLMAALFATMTRAEIGAEAQRRGVPIEAVRAPAELLGDAHLCARQAWLDVPVVPGHTGRLANGQLEFDGRRAGVRHLGQVGAPRFDDRAGPAKRVSAPRESLTPTDAGPFAGLRVLDLGVIVVGAETGRLFADLGADVIKVESRRFPDGARLAAPAGAMSPSFAWGHRGKRSIGIDLRSARGRGLFLELVARSDVVVSNFKPGTMESLGLGYDELRAAKPDIVVVESSALGRTGPNSRSLGYGPLVRATTGLTSLWRDPEVADGYCDAITIYPDHTAGRVGAIGGLAALIARDRTGAGGLVSLAQAEVMLSQFAVEFLRESIAPGTLRPLGNHGEFDAPAGLYPAAGHDQWCVISIHGAENWAALCAATGLTALGADPSLASAKGRVLARDRIDAALTEWTRRNSAADVMTTLQNVGVRAAAMLRVPDLLTDPQLAARRFFATLTQPELGELPTERGPATYAGLAVPAPRPAPLFGADTTTVARELLGLTHREIDTLVADGVLQERFDR
jgi:crotonobetainyl-CoA:carnitine CoA-transferase CaiB-like acyl-CoA transferase